MHLIITDLDATLLNHDYTWQEAIPTLTHLKEHNIPLVLNSSKTLAEMHHISQELGIATPIIAENGGQIAFPKDTDFPVPSHYTAHPSLPYQIHTQSPSRRDIIAHAHQLRTEHDYQFQGFHDWSTADIADHTGLDTDAASRSADRHVTEPIHWHDSEERYQAFVKELSKIDARALRGGRFIHLMGPADKADGLKQIADLYRQQHGKDLTTIALGDSPNDAAMLSAADIAIALPQADGEHRIQDCSAPTFIQAQHPAAKGWNQELQKVVY